MKLGSITLLLFLCPFYRQISNQIFHGVNNFLIKKQVDASYLKREAILSRYITVSQSYPI